MTTETFSDYWDAVDAAMEEHFMHTGTRRQRESDRRWLQRRPDAGRLRLLVRRQLRPRHGYARRMSTRLRPQHKISPYDEFNRLTAGSNTSTSLTWNYDRFGNRWNQNVLAGTAVATSNSFGNDNRAAGYTYDSAGNVQNDGINRYTYDAEGRITCTVSVAGGGSCTSSTGTHYAYDANGLRVASYSGATLTAQYLYNTQGQMVTELDAAGGWSRGEVYVRGMYLATYLNGTTTFAHTDWLGTIRYQTNLDGSLAETCTSLPFGDSLSCTSSGLSHKHFTGKLHDDDTGLDYFGARYFASIQGRFLTPDWSASPEAVPYGDFGNPQSLNLYAYVDNNPTTGTDPDGHLVDRI